MDVSDRCCMDCGCLISACMGFVLARDFIVALLTMGAGGVYLGKVRERCERCVEKFLKEECSHERIHAEVS